jgi:hypothetical protein
LVASYHKPLPGAKKLDLSTDAASQNYLFYQINDQASSKTSIGYEKGALVNASVIQTASQTTRVARYVMGHLESDTTTPVKSSKNQSFLHVLQQAIEQDKEAKLGRGTSWLNATLANIQDKILLQPNPAKLNG